MFNKTTGGTPAQDVVRKNSTDCSELHKHDDLDFDNRAHHHTLGKGQYQAASGAWVASLEARIKALEDG